MSDTLPQPPGNAALAALLFELASQLHVERARRIALELAMTRAGALRPDTLARLADDPELHRLTRAALDDAMARLMRVITESGEET